MIRVLFVDDDVRVLEGLSVSLRRKRHQWQMVVAASANEAMDALNAHPTDVLVTDIRMPGTSGAALLEWVQRHHPEVVRIVLSGQMDEATALRVVPLSHQFLSKPTDTRVLEGTIDNAARLRDVITHPGLRSAVAGMGGLPSAPGAFLALSQVVADPQSTFQDVATVLQSDPAMSAKILQVANSAFFGRSRRLEEVREAVAHLGLDLVHRLAMTESVFRSLASRDLAGIFPMDAFREHALMTARLAHRIAPVDQAKAALSAGVLHDIGRLVMGMAIPVDYRQVCDDAARRQRPLAEVEREHLDTDHAAVGALLLHLWGVPSSIVSAVAWHHRPREAPGTGFGAVHAVHVAEVLTRPDGDDVERATLDTNHLDALGVIDQLARWKRFAAELGPRAA